VIHAGNFSTAGHLPDLNDVVLTYRGQVFAVWDEGKISHLSLMTRGSHCPTAYRLPDPDDPVTT
jgi:hypothetical protein